ncbi:TetR family transcriptional regulator [Paenibacillus sp. IHB B 3415]|uniref:TetR/AcrR family transcriptional regulator n=1 Tax=Paenibacillus sp. IHB B 3415 TaxID=867080 RepID=UPI0005730706|nr:TetR/AcrR family transcriptional regulator [Paenibacillus sp. IHB B 3415]KHL97505.1 TetR family transcriptional regulator [Paenibacillus sp. IHB B 3415]
MTPRTKEQNEDIRLRRLAQIRKAAADVFLNKGALLEIRDVAAQAGLGYGTVYHYYSNKGDLLNDLLWDALDRAGRWLEAPRVNPGTTDSESVSLERAAAAGVRLLQLWAEDHSVYLLYKLAGEGFASLPEGRSSPLSNAFRQEVLTPFAALLETGSAAEGAAASGGNAAESPDKLQRAEMLLAAMTGCASLSLRRGKLHEEAGDIARLLKF